MVTHLHLGIGPAGDLDDHVEDTVALVGEEGDVVERRDDGAALLEVDTVLWGSATVSEVDGGWLLVAGAHRACSARR
jgi:hypothetical protein